jgi:aprataxin
MFYKKALLEIFRDSSKFDVQYEDENFWIINDKYPKAKYHFLLVPKEEIVYGIKSLTPDHIPMLEEMEAFAEAFISDAIDDPDRPQFIIGFHREPSLWQLHLHIISSDLSKAKTSTIRNKFKPPSLITIGETIRLLASG